MHFIEPEGKYKVSIGKENYWIQANQHISRAANIP
jgi:hypothetical protein